MPLSDREQRILSDIEAHLREEDPRLAQTVASATVASRARRRAAWWLGLFVLGVVLLLGLVVHVAFALAGLALMFVSAVRVFAHLSEAREHSGRGDDARAEARGGGSAHDS